MFFQKGVFIWLVSLFIIIHGVQGQYMYHDTGVDYLFPAENSVVNYHHVDLIWSSVSKAKSIKLQVATDELFTDIILDTTLYTLGYRLSGLERHKDYFWRIFNVDDQTATCRDISYTFFKTTSILIDESLSSGDVAIIPSWVDDREVLYIDNPYQKQYTFRIVTDRHELKFHHKGRLEAYAVKTDHWPRGTYIIRLQVEGSEGMIRQFSLN